jgi:membrane associated rhomboid family serine protease
MNKYFLANPLSKSTYLSMLLSTFSHQDPLHFFFNMACLWSFVMPLHSIFGGEQVLFYKKMFYFYSYLSIYLSVLFKFLAYYLSSGIFASFISNNYKIFTNRIGPSLGAVSIHFNAMDQTFSCNITTGLPVLAKN